MLDVTDYRQSLERSRRSRMRRVGESTFLMQGREWDLLPGVFAPPDSPSTAVALDLLGLAGSADRARGSMLEIGCGSGVIAVTSALAGSERVVAVDINEAAVENTARNAARHAVAHRVVAVHSDLFQGLDPADRFDTVFWSSNYVKAPEGYAYRNMHERAYVDPDYTAHRRFLTEAPAWLAPNGRVLLHFSTRGCLDSLVRIADDCDRALQIAGAALVQEGEHQVQHVLMEVTPRRPRCAAVAQASAARPSGRDNRLH